LSRHSIGRASHVRIGSICRDCEGKVSCSSMSEGRQVDGV
jgi:hypothetical protein